MSHKRGKIETGGQTAPGIVELWKQHEMAELMRCEMNRKLNNIVAARDYWDREASRILIELENFGMVSERRNITQPSDWWAAFEEAAAAEGCSLAEWLGKAGKSRLSTRVSKKLSDRPAANRPKKPRGEGR